MAAQFNRTEFLAGLARFANKPAPEALRKRLADELESWCSELFIQDIPLTFTVTIIDGRVGFSLEYHDRVLNRLAPAFSRRHHFCLAVPSDSWNDAVTAASSVFQMALELNSELPRVADRGPQLINKLKAEFAQPE